MARKWYDDPLLIAAIQFEQEGDDAFRAPAILDKAKFNTEQLLHVFGEAVVGMYEKERHYEDTKRYLSMTNGRNVIMYSNVHCMRKNAYEAHPERAAVDKNGVAIPAYTDEVLVCMNSPWRDFYFERIHEMLEFPIKGIFLDGPSFTDCYCPACQKLFKEAYGKDLFDATREEMRDFRIKQAARFTHDVREVIHSINPEIIVYPNVTGLSENVAGSDIDILYDDIDFLGTEGGFMFYGDPNAVSIYKTSQAARYMEAKANGKPYVIFSAGNHQPWARYMHTPAENEIICAAAVASGANLWYGVHGAISDFETSGGQAALNLISKLADNKLYYTDTKSRSDVAVLWPKLSVHAFPEAVAETDFTKAEKHEASRYGSSLKEFEGTCEILARNHITYDIIDEKNLRDDDLSKYPLIILPNAICLDDAAVAKIKAYVEAGGKLIGTLSTGLCDAHGKARSAGALNDVFGIESLALEDYLAGCSYLKVLDESVAKSLISNPTAGFAGASARVKFAENAEVIALLHEPMAGRYSYLPKETFPAVAQNKYGKGEAIYLCGGVGATFTNYGVADFKSLLNVFVNRLIKPMITLDDAYETVEVTVRDNPERTMIHFVNYTAQMRRPLENIIPCKGMKVTFKPGREVGRVFSMFDGKEIPFEKNGDTITFNFDVNGSYDVAVCE
ncbi:MAG: beta-galactosidase trimerization domain-containing protein [Clostridia bacterium]|nr:beta-galactosidase trimerization domain-containing protein [Clostridia bacterium]